MDGFRPLDPSQQYSAQGFQPALTPQQEVENRRAEQAALERAAKDRAYSFNPFSLAAGGLRNVANFVSTATSTAVRALARGPSQEQMRFDQAIAVENQKIAENNAQSKAQGLGFALAPIDPYTAIREFDGVFFGYVLKEGVTVGSGTVSADAYEFVAQGSEDAVMLLRVQRDAAAHGKPTAHGHIIEGANPGRFFGVAICVVDKQKNTEEVLVSGSSKEEVELKVVQAHIASKQKVFAGKDPAKVEKCAVNGNYYGYFIQKTFGREPALLGPYKSEAELSFYRGVDHTADVQADVTKALLAAVAEGRGLLDVSISIFGKHYGLVQLKDQSQPELIIADSKDALEFIQVQKLLSEATNGVILFKGTYYAQGMQQIEAGTSSLAALQKAGKVVFKGDQQYLPQIRKSLVGEISANSTISVIRAGGDKGDVVGYVGLVETANPAEYQIVVAASKEDLAKAKLHVLHANGKAAADSALVLDGLRYRLIAEDKLVIQDPRSGRSLRQQPTIATASASIASSAPAPASYASYASAAQQPAFGGLHTLASSATAPMQPGFIAAPVQPKPSDVSGRAASVGGFVLSAPLSSASSQAAASLSNPSIISPAQQQPAFAGFQYQAPAPAVVPQSSLAPSASQAQQQPAFGGFQYQAPAPAQQQQVAAPAFTYQSPAAPAQQQTVQFGGFSYQAK